MSQINPSGFIPGGLPPFYLKLFEDNRISRTIQDSLTSRAAYAADATPELLEMGAGDVKTFTSLGWPKVDQRPAPKLGAVPRMTMDAEQFQVYPQPYAEAFDLDAPSMYSQIGNRREQAISRLVYWAATTKSRLARQEMLAKYAAGQTVIRRAQTTAHSILLVDSLAGFRWQFNTASGRLEPVSGANPLPITIVAATTFTAIVIGTIPLDTDFPDGPGELVLSTTLSAAVAANSFTYVTGLRSKVYRAAGRLSTEALLSTDAPTLADVTRMLSWLKDQGIEPHADGTYHMHGDSTLSDSLRSDEAWQLAYQGTGIDSIWGPNAKVLPGMGLTVFEHNDAPGEGRGLVGQVGDATHSGTGGAGTPGSSKTMLDSGIPVKNSSGVTIRSIIITGRDVVREVYVDETKYPELVGGLVLHRMFDNVRVIQIGNMPVIEAAIDRWRMLFRAPMDERGLVSTVTVSGTFGYGAPTDVKSTVDDSGMPWRRAIVFQYGHAW